MYLGSVKFFRHLIVFTLIVCIAVPVFFAIRYGIKYSQTKKDVVRLNEVVSQYKNTPEDDTEDDFTKILDSSFSMYIPTFNQNVDSAISEQVDELQTQLEDSLDSRMADIQENIDALLDDYSSNIDSRQDDLEKQMTALIADQSAYIQQQLERKLDENFEELINQLCEALNDQSVYIAEQINGLRAGGGN